jgi:PAS domain S-box-containing protein
MSTAPLRDDGIHFQDVVEHLPLVPYVDRLDELSTAVYIGPQIEELTGHPWEDFRRDQELFLRLVHPDDRELYLSLVARRNRDKVPASGEYRLVRRDGRVVWVQDHERLVEDAAGRPVAAQGYLLDVTERRSHGVRLEAINAVLAAFSAGVSDDELVQAGLAALADALPGLRVSYVSLDRGGNLQLVHSAGRSPLAPIGRSLVHADDVSEYLEPLRRGETVSSADGSRADRFGAAFARLGQGTVGAFLDVPIRHGGRLVAILCTDSAEPRVFSPDEQQTLRELGRQLAVALERERAESDLRRRDEILSAVSRGAAVVLAGSTWEDAAPGLLESLGRAVAASRAYIFQLDPATAKPEVASQRFEWIADGISPELDNETLQGLVFADHDLDALSDALTHREVLPMLVRDLPRRARALMESQAILSLVTVPIVVESEPWGFVGFDDCEQERDWSPAETEALRAAASLIGAAIARERNESALREHETKVRAVFDASFDGIFLTDDDRRLVDLNDAAAAMFGQPREAIVGRRVDELLAPEQRGTLDPGWASFLAEEVVFGEYELLLPDGASRQLEYSARPSFLPGLSIAFVRDVTERRRLETRLQTAQRLESMGRVAGGVAHDFNNLLTAISGYTSLALERAAGDADLTADLSEIQRAAERAAELTRQLLAFGRRQVLSPRPLELEDVLRGVEGMLRRLVGEDVVLALHHDPATPTVVADAGQLEQVAVNLAMNAREAMPDGGTLTISTYPATREGAALAALEVTDTGVGMDAETRTRAFEPFFTTRSEGVGLGLASVYGIVTQSEGTIEVTSEPGRGTTFTVLLPATADVTAASASAAAEPGGDEGSETVLLVEDEEVVRALTRRVLEQHGYRVLESRNGHEAIGIAETHEGEIDVLLTDVVMPGLRGHEVADRIAATRPGIAVVYMSGYADEALLGRAAEGGSYFLEKPFSNAALARKLREALGTAGS